MKPNKKKPKQEGILRFDLSDPYARDAFYNAQMGTMYRIVLQGLDEYLRQIDKYGKTDKVSARAVRDWLTVEMEAKGVKLYD